MVSQIKEMLGKDDSNKVSSVLPSRDTAKHTTLNFVNQPRQKNVRLKDYVAARYPAEHKDQI